MDRAFVNFFKGRSQYPKYKKYGRYRSLTYPQIRPEDISKHSINLPKVGRVRMVKHRPLKGQPKTITIVRNPGGEWYAAITVELEGNATATKPTRVNNPVGADSGLTNYLYLSDGRHVDNPHFLKQHEERIKKAQRKLSRKKRIKRNIKTRSGETKTVSAVSCNWLKARILLAKRWRDYVDAKEDWQWKQANQLVAKYDFIAYEDLPISNMLKNHSLARAIQDASWGGFWGKVENKAATADSTCLTQKVNPRYTTQRCSRCGFGHQVALSERTFRCPNCGFIAPRDHNSAQTIREIGVMESGLRTAQPVGMDVPESTPAETEPLPPEPVMAASSVAETGNKFHACGRSSNRAERTTCTEAHELRPWENVTDLLTGLLA